MFGPSVPDEPCACFLVYTGRLYTKILDAHFSLPLCIPFFRIHCSTNVPGIIILLILIIYVLYSDAFHSA
jgi:hypothetical protein